MRELGPTLADAAVRYSFKHPHAVPTEVQAKIARARRFVLDESASAFMSDLSHATYQLEHTAEGNARAAAQIDQTRRMARAPHALTWVEFDFHAFHKRTITTYPSEIGFADSNVGPDGKVVVYQRPTSENVDLTTITPRIGVLIEQQRDDQFALNIISLQKNPATDADIPMTLPFRFLWTTDDTLPTQRTLIKETGRMTIGMAGAYDQHIAIVQQRGTYFDNNVRLATQLLVEFTGELRTIWALLAAINDIPIGTRHVVQSKGFVARGRYRKYLDHSIISIVLPKGRDPRKVAAQAVALSRRRAHPVRGHWRENWRFPLSALCQHEFRDAAEDNSHIQVCNHCGGRKTWITEHQRGDASLGFVLHDYRVKTEESPE